MMQKHWIPPRDDESHSNSPSFRSMTQELRAAAMALCDEETPPCTREEQIDADLRLIARVKRGDRTAFQEIYRRYSPSLFTRILRMLGGNMAQAEDCLQQVFTQALQSIHSYEGKGVLLAWLNRLTTFIVINEFRHQQGWQGTFKQILWSWDPRVRQSEAIPERLFAQEEVKAMLHQSLSQLHAKKRIVVYLCDLEGYSIEEAAAELGIAPGTVASRLHHGRKELRMLVLTACKEQGLTVEDWLHG